MVSFCDIFCEIAPVVTSHLQRNDGGRDGNAPPSKPPSFEEEEEDKEEQRLFLAFLGGGRVRVGPSALRRTNEARDGFVFLRGRRMGDPRGGGGGGEKIILLFLRVWKSGRETTGETTSRRRRRGGEVVAV